MIHIIMIVIAVAAAAGIMLLSYTKKGLKFRKEHGANDYITGLMMAIIIYFWGMDIVSLIKGTVANPSFTYIFVIGAPVLLAGWIIYTRIKIKEQMAAPPKPHSVGRRLK